MAFWQVFILFGAVAVFFVIWPLLKMPFARKYWNTPKSQDETQVELYHEHLEDLERNLALGDIDQAQFDELKAELQKTLLAEEQDVPVLRTQGGGKKLIVGFAVVVPLLAFVLYSQWGAKPDYDIYQFLQHELQSAESQADYNKKMREMVVKVQARLNQTPDNIQLLNLLAQSSMALQDYDLAVEAYEQVLEAFPQSPRIMANLAQAMFYRAGNRVTPEVREYVHKALAVAPMMPEMLGLAGIDARNRGDHAEAIRYWKMIVSQLDPESRTAKQYLDGIAKAEQAMAEAGQSPESSTGASASEEGAASAISVQVAIADDVAVQPDETLFIYARAWNGPKMPLAIKRMTAGDLPVNITLDKSMAMAPGMDITSFPELEVVARVSRSGSPAPQSGDWQATQGPVKLGELDGPVTLTIAEQVP